MATGQVWRGGSESLKFIKKNYFLTQRQDKKRHVIRVMRRHDPTNKKTMAKTNINTNTFREHPQRAIPETSDKKT